MNAAARLAHQGVLSRQWVFVYRLSRQQMTILLLTMAVLCSALSVIYVSHASRIMHANYQRNITEQDHLHVMRGQLLLERSTWMMQARIQQVAENKLGMVLPDNKSVVMIRE